MLPDVRPTLPPSTKGHATDSCPSSTQACQPSSGGGIDSLAAPATPVQRPSHRTATEYQRMRLPQRVGSGTPDAFKDYIAGLRGPRRYGVKNTQAAGSVIGSIS